MNIQNSPFLSNLPIKDRLQQPNETNITLKGQSFNEILQDASWSMEEAGGLKFSKHASQRLQTRSISLSGEQLSRLNEGAMRAGEKGIKDSLVLVDSYAFIVNVPNRTVVTAMDQGESKESAFTNIDGAVIA